MATPSDASKPSSEGLVIGRSGILDGRDQIVVVDARELLEVGLAHAAHQHAGIVASEEAIAWPSTNGMAC